MTARLPSEAIRYATSDANRFERQVGLALDVAERTLLGGGDATEALTRIAVLLRAASEGHQSASAVAGGMK